MLRTLPLILLLAAGCSASATDDKATACFSVSQGVATYNGALQGVRAGTATTSDTTEALKKAATQLDTAASIIPAGQLHDVVNTAAVAIGRARVALDANSDPVADEDAATAALDEAAPLCK
jgi:hypothetical protein